MASQIPLVKLEREAGREFYVFLGVDCDDSYRIPGGMTENFKRIGLRFEGHALRPDEIASMVQRQNIEMHSFNSLQYRMWEHDDPGNPFEQSDDRKPEESLAESCKRYELMLQWLSTLGEGTWQAFNKAGLALGLFDNTQDSRSAFRRFVLLAHIDVSNDGTRWSISPSALVRFPDDPLNGFLVGPRTNTMLQKIGGVLPLNKVLQSYYAGPSRIDLESGILSDDGGIAALEIVNAGITSIHLAQLLPVLDGWKNMLQPVSNLNISSYVIERWQMGKFEKCDTFYARHGVYHGETGLYRLYREGDKSGRTLTLFFEEPAQRWLRGDWYGLRFLALEAAGDYSMKAVYSPIGSELLVPASQRWPLLYERALSLASGLLPGQADNSKWLSYPRIPLNIARMLCKKLNVVLREM